MKSTFGIDPNDVLAISAKTGIGMEDVLQAIVSRIPPPTGSLESPTKALLFDSSLVPSQRYLSSAHYSQLRSLPRSYFSCPHFGRIHSERLFQITAIPGITAEYCSGDKIASCYTRKKYEVADVGLMHPEEEPTNQLQVGQVGYLGPFSPPANFRKASNLTSYLACNMKDSDEGGNSDAKLVSIPISFKLTWEIPFIKLGRKWTLSKDFY
jgi:hypothetical protein